MIYIYSVGTAVVLGLIMLMYLVRSGYFVLKGEGILPLEQQALNIPGDGEDDEPAELPEEIDPDEEPDNSNEHYGKRQAFMLTALFVLISIALNILLYKYTVSNSPEPKPFLFVKMALTHMIVAAAAITDYKRSKIPNALILFGAAARLIIYVLEFIFARDSFWFTLKNDGLGFLLGFGMLFIVAVVSRGALGFGDVKLFGVIGLMAGSAGVFVILFVSLLVNSIIALGLIAAKKKTFKSKMPMGPFIYAGYLISSVLGLF